MSKLCQTFPIKILVARELTCDVWSRYLNRDPPLLALLNLARDTPSQEEGCIPVHSLVNTDMGVMCLWSRRRGDIHDAHFRGSSTCSYTPAALYKLFVFICDSTRFVKWFKVLGYHLYAPLSFISIGELNFHFIYVYFVCKLKMYLWYSGVNMDDKTWMTWFRFV